jgi:hypothetical protein
MFGKNKYIGIALESGYIQMAIVKKSGKTIELLKLDRFELVEDISPSAGDPEPVMAEETATQKANADKEEKRNHLKRKQWDEVFGVHDSNGSGQDDDSELDFEELEKKAQADRDYSADILDDAVNNKEERSNSVLLYKILIDINSKSVNLGLNIKAGETKFQIKSNTDYSKVKTSDLRSDLENHIESIYGQPKKQEHYTYEVREDGSLVLASVENESPLLGIVNETRDIYGGKVKINSVYPDEAALVGLVKANYQLGESDITALIQFDSDYCQVVFLKGEEILQVMQCINRGTGNANFLNTIFSKLLFQIDSGEVPDINQIIIANNTIEEDAIAFFRQSFPNTTVESFQYNKDKFNPGSYEYESYGVYTPAIAAGWAAAGADRSCFPDLSLLPQYVIERQKIFKLSLPGILLLLLIFLSIPAFNYFYHAKTKKISHLSSGIKVVSNQIDKVQPVVVKAKQTEKNLTLLSNKLSLLEKLSSGSRAWSAKLHIIDRGMQRTPNSWFTTLSAGKNGASIKGYTLYRNRIPAIVNLFGNASLLSVTSQKKRGLMLYQYELKVKEFTRDSTLYSPEKPSSIKHLSTE